jgi:hypothetical protein
VLLFSYVATTALKLSCNMSKYFFDRIWRNQREYDYQGREFASPAEARDLAELIALDLEIEADARWAGWAVDVRNANNEHFFTILVRGPEFAAA